ncbi:hypothetical protein E4U37_000361 [Claviceps purpurea]|nr:hypothetical protein E4U37_000361 [Claviceps purpurea]
MSGKSYDGKAADNSATVSDTEHGEHDEVAFLAPQYEAEDPSSQQDGSESDEPPGSTLDATSSRASVQTPPSSVEILSPQPSPHVPSKNLMTAAVEDWEEDDTRDDAELTPPSSFCVTTPPSVEAALDPIAQEKTVRTAKPETCTQDQRKEPHGRKAEPAAPIPQSAQQNTSRRRPSVMDYLVSQGPVKYPASASGASSSTSRRVASESQCWQNNDQPPTQWGQPQPTQWGQPQPTQWGQPQPTQWGQPQPPQWGQPHPPQWGQSHPLQRGQPHLTQWGQPLPPGYQGEDRKQQSGWTAQQPSLASVDTSVNDHDDRGSEASYKTGFGQSWEQNGLPAFSSSCSVSNNDSFSEIYASQGYPDLASRLDNMAPSGYHLLATKLSGDSCGQPVAPIYRKFDALTHRLLLYMQDEISDLERQLISLEAKDTATRSYAGGVMPASQRHDRWTNSNLAHQKTEILGLIGYKLSQYNHVLESFCKVQDIPAPTWRDIHLYKSYLATSKLIVDDETRFLDASSDLISLNTQGLPADDLNTTVQEQTPMPKAAEEEPFHGFFKDHLSSPSAGLDHGIVRRPENALFVRLTLSCICMVLVPIMIFSVIPSFVGRMAIVLLIVLSVSIVIEQLGLLQEVERHREWMAYFGLYCGAMAVLARAVN